MVLRKNRLVLRKNKPTLSRPEADSTALVAKIIFWIKHNNTIKLYIFVQCIDFVILKRQSFCFHQLTEKFDPPGLLGACFRKADTSSSTALIVVSWAFITVPTICTSRFYPLDNNYTQQLLIWQATLIILQHVISFFFVF